MSLPSSFARAASGFAAPVLLLSILALAVPGCNKGADNSAAPSTTGGAAPATGASSGAGGAQTASGGLAIYEASGCTKCHGTPGQRPGRAPDLSHEGTNHDATWIAQHIKDPQSQNPQSRMPKYQGRISDPDLKTLSDYLASLK